MNRPCVLGLVAFVVLVACGQPADPPSETEVSDAGADSDVGVTDVGGDSSDAADAHDPNVVIFESWDPNVGDPLLNAADDFAGGDGASTSERCYQRDELPVSWVPEEAPEFVLRINEEVTALLAETFEPASASGYSSISPVDMNADGLQDLVVYGHLGGGQWGTRVFIGTIDGDYEAPVMPPWPPEAKCLAYADLQGDLFVDAICSGEDPGVIAIYYGTAEGLLPSDPQILGLADEGMFPNSVVVHPANGDEFLELFVATSGTNTLLMSTGPGTWEAVALPTSSDGQDSFYVFGVPCPFGTCFVVDNDGAGSFQEAYSLDDGGNLQLLEEEQLLAEPQCNVMSAAMVSSSIGSAIEFADWDQLMNQVIAATNGEFFVRLGLLVGDGTANPMAQAVWRDYVFPSLSGAGDMPMRLDPGTNLWHPQPALTIPGGFGVSSDGGLAVHESWGRRMMPTPTPIAVTAWGLNSTGEDAGGGGLIYTLFGIELGEGYVGSRVGVHALTTGGWRSVETDQGDRVANNLTTALGRSGTREERGGLQLFVGSFDGTFGVYDLVVENPVLSVRLHGDPEQRVSTEGYGAEVHVSCLETDYMDSQKMGQQYVGATSGNFTLGGMEFGVPSNCGAVEVTVVWPDALSTETRVELDPADRIYDIVQE